MHDFYAFMSEMLEAIPPPYSLNSTPFLILPTMYILSYIARKKLLFIKTDELIPTLSPYDLPA